MRALASNGSRRLGALRSATLRRSAVPLQSTSTGVFLAEARSTTFAQLPAALGSVGCSRSCASAAAASSSSKPTSSALRTAALELREAVLEGRVARDAGPLDEAAVQTRHSSELAAGAEELVVMLKGEALVESDGRKSTTITASDAARKAKLVLPSAEDIRSLLEDRASAKVKAYKPEVLAEALEKYMEEKYFGKRADHVALMQAWGSQEVGQADAEFVKVGAGIELCLGAYRAALKSSKENFQFEAVPAGDDTGKECLVTFQADSSQLNALGDVFNALLQGFRVVVIVPPQLFSHYAEIASDLADCGLSGGHLEIIPAAEDDPAVLHEALRQVDRLQFTGSSGTFRSLVLKAHELGNSRLEHSCAGKDASSHVVEAQSSISSALREAVREDAATLFCVAAPEGQSGLKFSAVGGMKTYSNAVVGDHDGVGSLHSALASVKRRGANWRDQEEAYAEYELTETSESLTEFLGPRDQASFPKQVASLLEVFAAFEPEVSKPRAAENGSHLVTLMATRPVRKHLLIPRGVGLPEDIVKLAVFLDMSPLKELPVDLHLLGLGGNGKLRVTDPLKSFLRVAQKRLGWRVHTHETTEELVEGIRSSDYPPYFYCVKERHMLASEIVGAVAERGGYLYEGLPADALSLFRTLTTTQAWTVACTEGQVAEATAALQEAWTYVGLREEAHPSPSFVKPAKRQEDGIGGGFGGGGFDPVGDKDWDAISDDEESSDDETDAKSSASKTEPAATAKATLDITTADVQAPSKEGASATAETAAGTTGTGPAAAKSS